MLHVRITDVVQSITITMYARCLLFFWPVNQRQDIQHCSHIRMVMAAWLFQVFQGLLAQRNGNFIATLRCILYDQIVQCTEPCRYFIQTGSWSDAARLGIRQHWTFKKQQIQKLAIITATKVMMTSTFQWNKNFPQFRLAEYFRNSFINK